MKTIGTTNDDGFLVEMSMNEMRHFERLVRSLEGREWCTFTLDSSYKNIDMDIAGALIAIRSFAIVKNKLNELKAIIESTDAELFKADDQEA